MSSHVVVSARLFLLSVFLLLPTSPALAVPPDPIEVVPSNPFVGGCIPFGNNTSQGFSGFIYRNLPAFELRPGDAIRFDLARENDVDVRRDVFFSIASENPGDVHGQGITATEWVQVVSEDQVPESPRGNLVVNDFELVYTAEAEFSFPGGGLVVGFSASPPAAFADAGCESVVVSAAITDPSGNFYGRFFRRPHLDASALDQGTGATSFAVAGIVIEFMEPDPPTADAGPDQTVDEGAWVVLDGSASLDPAGAGLDFTWVQTGGPGVVLSGADTSAPTFQAPYLDANAVLSFQLIVSDDTNVSDPDLVDVTVKQVNNRPEAHAGADGTIKEGATGALDGTSSFDPDGDALTSFAWTQVDGPDAGLVDADQAQASFTAPFGAGERLVFKLQVSDGFEPSLLSTGADSSFDDTVAMTVVANSPPQAAAGDDMSADERTAVELDGTGSQDPDGDGLSFDWRQVSGTAVSLAGAGSARPSFETPPVGPGGEDLVFELMVHDDDHANPLSSDPDLVTVHVTNVGDAPSCGQAHAVPDMLWPPNHRMRKVKVGGLADAEIQVTGVRQDEPVKRWRRFGSSPDAVLAGSAAWLRAERLGRENGRVYVVEFEATNGDGSCTGTVRVEVPRHPRKPAFDDGAVHDSTAGKSAHPRKKHDHHKHKYRKCHKHKKHKKHFGHHGWRHGWRR